MSPYPSFCSSCGKPLPEGNVEFCPSCGKPQSIGQAPQPVAPQYQQQYQQYQQPVQPQYPSQYQQPAQSQWNPNGYYPMSQTPQKKSNWVGWIVGAIIILVAVGAAGFALKNIIITQAVTASQPVGNGGSQTQATPHNSGFADKFALIPAPGSAGQELVGQSGQDDTFLMTVTGVKRISEIHGDGKVFTSQGVFLILTFDLKNVSKASDVTLIYPKLTDSQGRTFSASANLRARAEIDFAQQFPDDVSVEPGFTGHSFELFEVASDSTSLKFVVEP